MGRAAVPWSGRTRIAIAATFTAQPLEEIVSWWLATLGVSARVELAPSHQIHQALLDPGSALEQGDAHRVVVVRFEDLAGDAVSPASLVEAAEELSRSLRVASERSRAPLLVIVCPPSESGRETSELASAQKAAEDLLAARSASLTGPGMVDVVRSDRLAQTYPVSRFGFRYDRGEVPLTPEAYAALGTLIARHLYRAHVARPKVVVVDCDNTLWEGVLGEDGVGGIRIGAAHRALQDRLVALHREGVLVCLCSKNDEADVDRVFETRRDMPLRREHVTAMRIDWTAKSSNLRSLAAELGLGLDSFLFLDDSAVECAEVRAFCPSVLALQLPREPADWERFLQHVWILDSRPTTDEDRSRGQSYLAEQQRESQRDRARTLGDFLSSLELRVDVSPLDASGLRRAAQLSQRTNQLNASSLRRDEAGLADFLARGGEGLAFAVRDRFGDYGTVGLALFRVEPRALEVDTFLLSCRALGRGVEHRMLAALGELAARRGVSSVQVSFRHSERNQPAEQFLVAAIGRLEGERGDRSFAFSAGRAATFAYDPDAEPALHQPPPSAPGLAIGPEPSAADHADLLTRIATELFSADALIRRRSSRGSTDDLAPEDPLERAVIDAWTEALAVDGIGPDDDFFALGGDSLRAAIVINRLQERFEQVMHVPLLLEARTPRALARAIESEYPHAVARITGVPSVPRPSRTIAETDLAALERLAASESPAPAPDARNPPAVFVLAPPRSGTTLLRVMLAGHSRLFAPPELHLLSKHSLRERRAAFRGRGDFMLEGTARAIMALRHCDADAAQRILSELEDRDATSAELYGVLQRWCAPRLLVDKTPTYALDPEVLRRAEQWFDRPRYIHLTRDPRSTVRSLVETHLHMLMPLPAHEFSPPELGELIWTLSHRNIGRFLAGVDRDRTFRLRFEDLVRNPVDECERLCGFLDIAYEPAMVDPYSHPERRMTDGLRAGSRMIGDAFTFPTLNAVDPTRAEIGSDLALGDVTWRVAEELGYR